VPYYIDSTLVDVLSQHALDRPKAKAFSFLGRDETETEARSFAELDQRARAIASRLSYEGLSGKLVLLLLTDSAAFIDALMGCFYAGVIPVPAVVPRANRPTATIEAIARDAGVVGVLTGRRELTYLKPALSEALPNAGWYCLEDVDGDPSAWPGRQISTHDLAFLQYTSGSTGAPKGVMVTHGNLMANEAAIQRAMGLSSETIFVSWLPLFHDMGLIGSVLQPLYLGVPCVLMPTVAFLQRPLRWLKAIDAYGGTISGAPNFAYDLCVDRIPPEQRAELDLSSWTVAFNGSEPVRAATIERFSEAFAVAGFKRKSFYPCYGMAETTLLAAGVEAAAEPEALSVDRAALGRGSARAAADDTEAVHLVSCGRAAGDAQIVIVDPDAHIRLPACTVGEIWISGDSVAAGYYQKPAASDAAFGARLASTADGPFLRTGDLGFLSAEGQLFITGRLKDVIIVRGHKHYPQDLEATAARSNRLLAAGRCAAFALDEAQGTIAIVQELTGEGWHHAVVDRVAGDVREAIARDHGLTVAHVALIKPGSLPRTSSGKVRRSTCRRMLEAGAFATWSQRSSAKATAAAAPEELRGLL